MMAIQASEFGDFFRGVHGVDPFPWQQRLAEQVLTQGRWPDVLALPTGSGKTSVLDVALFCLAAAPERFARRVVLVIDRRVVVDQGAARAQHIESALQAATAGIVARVAQRLRALWGGQDGQSPIETAVLRGGMPRDDAWARRPDRPVLAVSTVDQVGSRLLFRGYGVSSRMSSVHAGLLGHDALFLLDEVHLSVPFAQTLLALRGRWRGFHGAALPDRWGVVRMSATPGLAEADDQRFGMDSPAWAYDEQHPVLRPRLVAAKRARLQEVHVKGRDEQEKGQVLARHCARAARQMLERGVMTVCVVVNRVAVARHAAADLSASDAVDVQLLTGRMRGLDRDAHLRSLLPRVEAGRSRSQSDRPLVVVATQCIEAGADFDFDALVTECASLDALRQRFGRLDRLGRLGETHATILARSDQVADAADPDPIYGPALKATWHWLGGDVAEVDFGVAAMEQRLKDAAVEDLLAPHPQAPILLPAHLDAWCQTHPRPWPDPEVPLWLHGPRRGEPEVQLVWRADIDIAAAATPKGLGLQIDRLTACPPAAAEALSLPMSAVRRWLAGSSETLLADAPMAQEEARDDRPSVAPRQALVWAGEDSRATDGTDLEPGMTLVLHADDGGIHGGNWDPEATDAPVSDLGDLAQWQTRRRATLRLHPATLPAALQGAAPCPRAGEDDDPRSLREKARDWLAAQPQDLPAPWPEVIGALRRRCRVIRHQDGTLTLVAPPTRGEGVSTEDDGASFTEQECSLALHSQHVRSWAERFVNSLGLPALVARDIVLAAWLHDVGKADPRFQRWLVGGSEVRLALLDEPLAKSGQTLRDRTARELAREQAGYPSGYRHELLSVAMVQLNQVLLAQAHDADLVLHLVGSHHGWCRPFAPLRDDEQDLAVSCTLQQGPGGLTATLEAGTRHRLARLDSGVADRFWRLTERYGWWGLAWLEAILRLADHRASESGGGQNDD